MNTDTRSVAAFAVRRGAAPSLTSTTLPSAPEITIPSRSGAAVRDRGKTRSRTHPITNTIAPKIENRVRIISIRPTASSGSAIFAPSGASGSRRRGRTGRRAARWDKESDTVTVSSWPGPPAGRWPARAYTSAAGGQLPRPDAARLPGAACLKLDIPARYSPIHSLANLPDWISARISFIAWRAVRTHHPLAAGHIAIFRRVADRVAHVRDAALVDQIDDQLDLVQAFEIRHLGRVARFNQGLVSGPDQFGQPAAQHRLLAEQVGFGFFLEAGFDNRGASATDRRPISQSHFSGIAGRDPAPPRADRARRAPWYIPNAPDGPAPWARS